MLTFSIDYLRAEIEYNPSTGSMVWRNTSANGLRVASSPCGRLDKDGYRILNIENHSFMAHRIAWAMAHGAFPSSCIDHWNGIRDDNRLSNLRIATRSQNIANTAVKAASGIKGVTQRRNGSWQAQIKVNGINRYLGTHKTIDQAEKAYEDAARSAFGEFRFSNRPPIKAVAP